MSARRRYVVLGAGGVGCAIGGMLQLAGAPVGGVMRRGGSSWQRLSRRTGTIETDSLNGEVVRLGERHGVATPLNRALTSLARRAAFGGWPPGRLTTAELALALEAPG